MTSSGWPRDAVRSRPRPGAQERPVRPADIAGKVERDGATIAYEVRGDGPTVLFMPTWSLVHSRLWKGQVPYLSRHARVITYDPRGNGRSSRPLEVEQHTDEQYVLDALAVLDATDTERAVVVCFSKAAMHGLTLAAEHPERVAGLVAMGPAAPLTRITEMLGRILQATFERRMPTYPTWQTKFNAHYWKTDFRDFLESYIRAVFNEPHSTKQIEDAVGWGLETTPEAVLPTFRSGFLDLTRRDVLALADRVRCPVLAIAGDRDVVTPLRDARALAERTGGRLHVLEGSGHAPTARNPVPVNVALRSFLQPEWKPYALPTMTPNRPKRVLYLSSAIGLGHARRDLAVVRALRERVESIEVDWLTQEPVSRMLREQGEQLHPASDHLAGESAHIESEAQDHDLHIFQAWRRMDEIFVNNYMVLRDVVREQRYDLVVGNEAWDLDYFWHENPEEKVAPYAWFTDFVGWVPMASGGEHERFLAADYNTQMVEHIAGNPSIRDLALFVGSPTDLVEEPLGPELPTIRDWTVDNFDFTGYITGFEPIDDDHRAALRAEFGYRDDDQVCIVTVGGSGVGTSLLQRIIAAYPAAKRRLPGLRMVVVAGPRIDPDALPHPEGVEVVGYVPALHRCLAACDVAIIQGGLTTAMELTANQRPFLYFPLQNHFEQQVHVPHRLDRYRAGRKMDIADADPESIAEALVERLSTPVRYLPVESDGAERAAEKLAAML
jgi:pimeloyl-ACP methyl ester carboxylesterase/predicted glycosyltransferase